MIMPLVRGYASVSLSLLSLPRIPGTFSKIRAPFTEYLAV